MNAYEPIAEVVAGIQVGYPEWNAEWLPRYYFLRDKKVTKEGLSIEEIKEFSVLVFSHTNWLLKAEVIK